MILVFVATEDEGVLAVLGLTTEDLTLMVAGRVVPTAPLERSMEQGFPLPKALQVLYGVDDDDIMEQVQRVFPETEFERYSE